jgi:hypothetical protein
MVAFSEFATKSTEICASLRQYLTDFFLIGNSSCDLPVVCDLRVSQYCSYAETEGKPTFSSTICSRVPLERDSYD